MLNECIKVNDNWTVNHLIKLIYIQGSFLNHSISYWIFIISKVCSSQKEMKYGIQQFFGAPFPFILSHWMQILYYVQMEINVQNIILRSDIIWENLQKRLKWLLNMDSFMIVGESWSKLISLRSMISLAYIKNWYRKETLASYKY